MASPARGSYLRDKFHRLKARRGHQRAAVAIAHEILTAVYVMLSTVANYRALGAANLDSIDTQRVTPNLVRRLERLGYQVALTRGAALGPAVQEQDVG
jgi:transposase